MKLLQMGSALQSANAQKQNGSNLAFGTELTKGADRMLKGFVGSKLLSEDAYMGIKKAEQYDGKYASISIIKKRINDFTRKIEAFRLVVKDREGQEVLNENIHADGKTGAKIQSALERSRHMTAEEV